MAKSLQDIEQDFYKRHKQEKKKKRKNLSLISDIIFCGALVVGGFSALILSWGERGHMLAGIYDVLFSYREPLVGIVFILIIVSFVLRFCEDKG
jgi:hypothetical protein